MTQKEKIILLKNTIQHLYENEGRSKSYISRLLEVDRKTLTHMLNNVWKMKQKKVRRLKPSNKKFLNKNRQFIKTQLDNDVSITEIAEQLNVDRQYLSRTIIRADDVLTKAVEDFHNRKSIKKPTKFNTPIENKKGEVWKHILGYDGYMISNFGRVKSNVVGDRSIFYELKPNINSRNGRLYVHLYRNKKRKSLSIARLVGHNFVDGYSTDRNTINHKDGDVTNNHYSNLEWVSQSDNNKHSYRLGRSVNVGDKKWKKIVLDGKYEFKTIRAFARFIDKSETQARRYLTGECKFDRDIKIVY